MGKENEDLAQCTGRCVAKVWSAHHDVWLLRAEEYVPSGSNDDTGFRKEQAVTFLVRFRVRYEIVHEIWPLSTPLKEVSNIRLFHHLPWCVPLPSCAFQELGLTNH